jgi:putative peptidoglycan lipid II flippase
VSPPNPELVAGPAATDERTQRASVQRVRRDTATITVWNTVSRLTGFVRVLAVGAALGTTFLGNTYQSANLVSNILFELLAAGLLAAPLVPAFVGLLDRGDRAGADRLTGALLTFCIVGLGAVALAGMLASHYVMHLLTADVRDPATRAAEIRLGTFWLWFFLPQLVLYGVGAVASAHLNGQRRFAAVSFAPIANNVTVTVTMVVFVILRHGHAGGGLELTTAERVVVGLGTTAGVIAMTAVPVATLLRGGSVRFRPGRIDWSSPLLREVARVGLWSGAFLAADELLGGVTLVLANRIEGGVVAYQIAYTFFLLPFAVLAHPIFTALYPRLSADVHAGRWDVFGRDVAGGVRLTAFLVLPASALLAALAEPGLRLVRFGAIDEAGASMVGKVLAAYAIGLTGYAIVLLLVRAATAAGLVKAAAVVGGGVLVLGAGLMVLSARATSGASRVVVLGLSHSVAMTLGAVVLFAIVRRRAPGGAPVGGTLVRGGAVAVMAGTAAWMVTQAIGSTDRTHAFAALVAGGVAGVAVLAIGHRLLRSPELAQLRSPDFGLSSLPSAPRTTT